jgi:pimeloyl-ACP methyl ester carboxylesterase
VPTWTGPDGTRIAYRRLGDGPATILVHGGFLDGSSMTGLMQQLAATRTTFAPDRRGHGASSPYAGPHSFSDDVADLVGFTRVVTDELGEGCELVAHSAGCHVALAAAAATPVARVVLWEPPDFSAQPISPSLWGKLTGAAARGNRKAVVRLLLNDVVGANTGSRVPWFVWPMLFRSELGRTLLANALATPTELAAFEAHVWQADDLARLAVPVYPLVGSTSPPFNRRFADLVAQHVQGAQVEVVAGGDHGTPVADPASFAGVLKRLREREAQQR